MVRGEVKAVLNIERKEKNAFTEKDTKLITILADHISSTLSLLHYQRRLSELYRYGSEIGQSSTVIEAAKLTLNVIQNVFETRAGSVGLVEGEHIKYVAFTTGIEGNWTQKIDGPGVCARAVREKRSQLIQDIRIDSDYVRNPDAVAMDSVSELAVPILLNDEPVAIINLESNRVNAYNEEDLSLMETLAYIVGINIERIQLLETERNNSLRLMALHQHSMKLANSKTREEVAAATMDIISDILGYTVGSFGYVEKDKIIFKELRGDSNITAIPLSAKSITVRTVLTGESQLVADTRNDPDYMSGRMKGSSSLSELDVPVKIGKSVVALINLESDYVNTFKAGDQQLLETLALHVSSTLKNIEYQEKMEFIHRFTLTLEKTETIEEAMKETQIALKENLGYPVVDIICVENNILKVPLDKGNQFAKSLDSKGITTRAARTRTTQLVNDTSSDPDYFSNRPPNRSELSVPVIQDDKLRYILNIESKEREAFTSYDQYLVEMIGLVLGQATVRIEHMVYLEKTVKRRTSELLKANHRLEKLSEMKTRFVSTATHELRTPLTVMKGYLELSMESDEINVIKSYLDTAYKNTNRFEALVNDLLDQQRIEEGRLTIHKKPFELNQMICTVVDEMRTLIGTKNQKIDTTLPEDDITVNWDEERIIQVLVNLLSNASKYSMDDTKISVVVEKHDENVQVSITDEGYGFKQEELDKLFKPFPDLQRPVHTQRSVGLGLAICKGIVDLHGGEIGVESQGYNMGSTFRLIIPINNSESATQQTN